MVAIAEQTSQSRYRPSTSAPGREIDVTLRLEVPGEDGVDVDAALLFEPALPPRWEQEVNRRLYEGIHAGLAAVGRPLPSDGIRVTVTALSIAPSPVAEADDAEVTAVGETIRAITAAMVEALWSGLGSSLPVGS